MFQQIQIEGRQICPMVDVLELAERLTAQAPSQAKQNGLAVLMANGAQNPVTAGLQNKILGILSECSNSRLSNVYEFVQLAANLSLITAALQIGDPYGAYGPQGVQQLNGVKADLAFKAGQWADRNRNVASHQTGYSPYEQGGANPYAPHPAPQQSPTFHTPQAQGSYNPNGWATDVPHVARTGETESFRTDPTPMSTHGGFEVIGEHEESSPDLDMTTDFNGMGDIHKTEVPSDHLYGDTDDGWGVDLFEDVKELPPTDLTKEPDMQPEPKDVDHEVVDSIDDVELFEPSRVWRKKLKDKAVNILGAVIMPGTLLIPVNRTSLTSKCRTGYIEFNRAAHVPGKDIATTSVYIAIKELPMDYETLSPNPIVISNTSNVTVKERKDLVDEEFAYHVTHETVECNPKSNEGNLGASILAASFLSAVGASVPVSKAPRTKTGMFMGRERGLLSIQELKNVEDFEKPVFDIASPVAKLLADIVSAPCRRGIVLDLETTVKEMLAERFEFPMVKWSNIVTDWDDLIQGIIDTEEFEADVVHEEFNRCKRYAFEGVGYEIKEVDSYAGDKPEWNEDDITSLATTPVNKDASYYAVMVTRRTAHFASWLTNDEMGLLKDCRLSTATHNTIAEPILGVFDRYPTIQVVTVIDVNGQYTRIYRGVGRQRSLVVCD